jgi:hypothetical protein
MMRTIVIRFVLSIGIAYGVAAFLFGLAGSFTLNSRDLVESVLLLLCGFLATLPIAILAIWKPSISAVLLSICLVVIECSGLANDGWHGAVLVGRKLALQNIVLVVGYAYIAFVRSKTRTEDSA